MYHSIIPNTAILTKSQDTRANLAPAAPDAVGHMKTGQKV
jgi:hypothetical protein